MFDIHGHWSILLYGIRGNRPLHDFDELYPQTDGIMSKKNEWKKNTSTTLTYTGRRVNKISQNPNQEGIYLVRYDYDGMDISKKLAFLKFETHATILSEYSREIVIDDSF